MAVRADVACHRPSAGATVKDQPEDVRIRDDQAGTAPRQAPSSMSTAANGKDEDVRARRECESAGIVSRARMDDRETERGQQVTPLELFFDLVLVFAITQV